MLNDDDYLLMLVGSRYLHGGARPLMATRRWVTNCRLRKRDAILEATARRTANVPNAPDYVRAFVIQN